MLDIYVCIGSSCHLKGSYEVVERLKTLILKNKLSNRVTLKASFCMGDCTHPVCMRIEEQHFNGITPQDIDDFFKKEILSRV
ncbi:MAG: (2Fe-2S) ferredoxin domain-containing protein [Bacillota bacterium]